MKNKFNYKKMPFSNKEASKFFVLRAMNRLIGNEMVVSYDETKTDPRTKRAYRNYRIYFKAYENKEKNANEDLKLSAVDGAEGRTCYYDELVNCLNELRHIKARNLWQRIINKHK